MEKKETGEADKATSAEKDLEQLLTKQAAEWTLSTTKGPMSREDLIKHLTNLDDRWFENVTRADRLGNLMAEANKRYQAWQAHQDVLEAQDTINWSLLTKEEEKLTKEEEAEVKARPVCMQGHDFSADQIKVRQGIAVKLCKWFEGDAKDGPTEDNGHLTAEHRTLYAKFPLWGFYVDDASTMKRAFGSVLKKDEPVLHTLAVIQGTVPWLNKTLGGTPASKLTRVEQWTVEQQAVLKLLGQEAGLFLDPLGFVFCR